MSPVDMIFSAVGGLAMFLFGMELLSNGLKRAAGDRLRSMLGKVTRFRLMALLAGAGVTCLIQSSSATTVMVVGLINAGLLTLQQAISVVLGANIGTTITSWIVAAVAGFKALKISTYALPFIGIGFAMQTFGRRHRWRTTGSILLGLGLLFVGLSFMKDSVGDLGDKQSSPLIHALMAIGDRPILAVLAGAAFTMLIQSSSASIAMVIVLATNGGFGENWPEALRIAIPFVLGDNIGTTITAQLAALRTNMAGKRAAMAHSMFNVMGVLIVLPLVYLGLFQRAIEYIAPVALSGATIGVYLAIAHSMFNITAALVALPMVGLLERAVTIVLPIRQSELSLRPVALEEHLLSTPSLAMQQVRGEIVRMMKTACDAVDLAAGALAEDNAKVLKKVHEKEEATDDFQTQITSYLVRLSQESLEGRVANELPVLLHTVNDIERVADHALNIAEIASRKIDKGYTFGPEAEKELDRMKSKVGKMFEKTILAVEESDTLAAAKAIEIEGRINEMNRTFRRNHVRRLGEGICHPLSGLVFVDYLQNMEKIGDHLTNVAQGVLGGGIWSAQMKLHTDAENADADQAAYEGTVDHQSSETPPAETLGEYEGTPTATPDLGTN